MFKINILHQLLLPLEFPFSSTNIFLSLPINLKTSRIFFKKPEITHQSTRTDAPRNFSKYLIIRSLSIVYTKRLFTLLNKKKGRGLKRPSKGGIIAVFAISTLEVLLHSWDHNMHYCKTVMLLLQDLIN